MITVSLVSHGHGVMAEWSTVAGVQLYWWPQTGANGFVGRARN